MLSINNTSKKILFILLVGLATMAIMLLIGDLYYSLYTFLAKIVMQDMLGFGENADSRLANRKVWLMFRHLVDSKSQVSYFAAQYMTHSVFPFSIFSGIAFVASDNAKEYFKKLLIGFVLLELFFMLKLFCGGYDAYLQMLTLKTAGSYVKSSTDYFFLHAHITINQYGSIGFRPMLVIAILIMLYWRKVINYLSKSIVKG